MDYSSLNLIEIRNGIRDKKFTSSDVCQFFIKKCQEKRDLNAIIEIFDDVMTKAKEIDQRISAGEKVGALAGVPIAIKDNILYKGKRMGCASNILKSYVAPYSSTVVTKLLKEDAIIIGRTNMDEFAMGGSCENSAYGACHNAVNFEYAAGGSSGGSAVAVAAGLVPCAIGTDTGGSIRQPASFNGVVGLKPTYGRVSRYGIVAFASSLDQAGPIAKTVEDCALVLDVISGKDENDGTTIEGFSPIKSAQKKKIGVCKELMSKMAEQADRAEGLEKFNEIVEKMKANFEVVEVSIPHILNSLACYYILAPAEATSNLARFDGVKYSTRSESATDLESVYVKSRSEGFGKEVKRRIMLGNFVLSSGYFDAYYNKAKKLQRLLRKEFNEAFADCDCLITPTTYGTAFKIGQLINDPVSMYLEDLFTTPANLAGIPAISIPYATAKNGLPLGVQIMAQQKGEKVMIETAKELEALLGGNK